MKYEIQNVEHPGAVFATTAGDRILVDTRDHEAAAGITEGTEVDVIRAPGGMSDDYLLSCPVAKNVRCVLVAPRSRGGRR